MLLFSWWKSDRHEESDKFGNFPKGKGGGLQPPQPGREKVGRWNEQSALQAMCDAEKDWHERSFLASGAFGGRQNLPFNKPENSFSFFIFQPAVHYD